MFGKILGKSSAINLACEAMACVGKISKKREFCANLGGVARVCLRGDLWCNGARQWYSKSIPALQCVVCFAVALWQRRARLRGFA